MTHSAWPDDPQPAPPPGRPHLMTFGIALLLTLAALALYALTLAPSVGWGPDAALQLAAVQPRLGGGAGDHPLFVALANATLHLPIGEDLAARANLAAALCGALTVLVVFLTSLRLLDRARLGGAPRGRLLYAALGALSLALAHGFWLRSVTPAPAALAALLVALLTWFWVRRLLGGNGANMLLAAALLGLALAVDIGLAVLVPIVLLCGLWLLWRPPARPEAERGRFRRGRLTVDTAPVAPPAQERRLAAADDAWAPGDRQGEREADGGMHGGEPDPGRLTAAAGGPSPPPVIERPRRAARRRPSLLGAAVSLALAFGIGLVPLAALEVAELVRTPLRADFATEILPGHHGPVAASIAYVGRRAVAGRLDALAGLHAQSQRLLQLGAVQLYNFLLFATVFSVLGALTLLVRRGTVAAGSLLLVLVLVGGGAAILLPAADLAAAFLPFTALIAIWVGVGAAVLFRGRAPWTAGLLAVLVIGSPLAADFIAPPLAARQPLVARLAGWVAPPAPGAAPAEQLRPWRHGLRAPAERGTAILEAATAEAATAEGAAREATTAGAAATGALLAVVEPASRPLSPTLAYLQRVGGLGAGAVLRSVQPDSSGGLLSALTPLLDRGTETAPLPVYLATADSLDLMRAGLGEAAGGWRAVPRGAVWQLVQAGPGTAGATRPAATPADSSQSLQPLQPTPPWPEEWQQPEELEGPEGGQHSRGPAPAGATAGSSLQAAEADSLFAAGSYWQAATIYGTALPGPGAPLGPHDAERFARFAVALAQSQMPVMSQRARRRFLGAATDTMTARRTLARLFLQAGDPARAIEELDPLLQEQPAGVEPLLLLAEAHAALGQIDRAHTELSRVLAIDPQRGPALYQLGRLLEQTGSPGEAAELYRRYLALAGGDDRAEVERRLAAIEQR